MPNSNYHQKIQELRYVVNASLSSAWSIRHTWSQLALRARGSSRVPQRVRCVFISIMLSHDKTIKTTVRTFFRTSVQRSVRMSVRMSVRTGFRTDNKNSSQMAPGLLGADLGLTRLVEIYSSRREARSSALTASNGRANFPNILLTRLLIRISS